MRTSYDESKITQEMRELLAKSGNLDPRISTPARYALAAIAKEQLRAASLPGDIVSDIYTKETLQPGASPEFQLDVIAPGTEKEFVGFTIPKQGYIPRKVVESDYLMLHTYPTAAAIDWSVRWARDMRWPVIARNLEILESMMVKKRNDDGWHLLVAAGLDRNIVVYDADAPNGQFSKRLVSLMKTVMRRNGGGNSSSINRSKLTDLYMSPENIEDMRSWNIDQIDEVTRREIYLAPDGTYSKVFGVVLHDIDELGEGQEYQTFYTDLGGTLQSGKLELVVGLDLVTRDVFKMVVRQDIEVFPDDTGRRSGLMGYWAEWEGGFGVLDNRSIILGCN